MNAEGEEDRIVDARGKMCPEPILLARRALDELVAGATIRVLATDPHAELDFEAFAARTGHELLSVVEKDGEWMFRLRHRGPAPQRG